MLNKYRDTRAGKINTNGTNATTRKLLAGIYVRIQLFIKVSTNITNFKKTPVCFSL
ncbi:MAG: hypothetical protein R2801_10945 [Chitinophagales bacterium]